MFFKKITKTAVAAVLCASLFFGAVGCSSSDGGRVKAEDKFEAVRTDTTLFYNSRGEFSLNVLSDTVDFNEQIGIDDVLVCYATINDSVLPEIDSEKGISLTDEEFKVNSIKPTNITRNSAKSVTVDFSDPNFNTNRPSDYIIVFKKNTNSKNKFLCAGAGVRYPSFSLVSDVSQINSDAVPVRIRLTLDSSTFTENISADDIILSGSFEDSGVGNFERIGENTLSFVIDKIKSDYIKTGRITVKASAVNDAPQDIFTNIRVIYPSAGFAQDSLRINGNSVDFTVNLQDCQFNERITPDMLTTPNSDITVTKFERVSQSQANVTLLYGAQNAMNLSDIIAATGFTIAPSALNISDPVQFRVDPDEPDVNVQIDSLTHTDGGTTAVLNFDVSNGTFNSVSRTSLVFTGDFSSAEVTSVTSQNDRAEVRIDIPNAADKTEFFGSIALKAGSVADRWGVNRSVAAVPLYYSLEEAQAGSDRYTVKSLTSEELIAALNEVVSQSDIPNVSHITDFMNASSLDREALVADFQSLTADNVYIDDILALSADCVKGEHISQTGEHINRDRAELSAFLSDIRALWAASRRASERLPQLAELEEQIASCTDKNELDTLNAQYEEYADTVRSTGNSTVEGTNYSEFLDGVISEYIGYNGEKSALECFDDLTDCMYNWKIQTLERKNNFRYAVNSVILQACYISLYSMSFGQDASEEYDAASSLIWHLADHIEHFSMNDADGNAEMCSTLGKNVSLKYFSFSALNGEVTSDEITQLLSMLPTDTTLREELESVGFDVSRIRYLVCSDSAVSSTLSFSTKTIDGKACMLYTLSSKASVYDLIRNEFINEFEYENITTVLSVDDTSSVPSVSQTVNTALKLYSMK